MSPIFLTDCRELFEVAYKVILTVPKRDVRALCANQSSGGTTKKRQKKKPKVEPVDSASAAPQPLGPQIQPQQAPAQLPRQPPPFVPVPAMTMPNGPVNSDWTSRNPALAQYHQYVWQTQQNAGQNSTEDAFTTIMQRLKAAPKHSPQVQDEKSAPLVKGADVVLPPPQFNMGQPPPTLLQSARDGPGAARQSYQLTPQEQRPPQHYQAPLSHLANDYPPQPSYTQPSQTNFTNIPEQRSDSTRMGQYQHWAPQYQLLSSSLQPHSEQRHLVAAHQRPIALAPIPRVQQPHPTMPQYRPQYEPWKYMNSQNRQ
jgi:hypothetical protein